MVPHVVRHKREEMGLLVILPGPVVLATSTTILRRVGRVLLDLPMMAVFSVASLSMTMSILHVGLVPHIELQLHRDVLHDLVQAHAGEDDLHPQRLPGPPLHVVEAQQPLPHGVSKYLHVHGVLKSQHPVGLAQVPPEELHDTRMGILRRHDPHATRFLARFFSSSSTLLFQLLGRTSFSR